MNLTDIIYARKRNHTICKVCFDCKTCKICECKKKNIKHMAIKGPKYLCNEAVKPTISKMTKLWSKVTCKNCLKSEPK